MCTCVQVCVLCVYFALWTVQLFPKEGIPLMFWSFRSPLSLIVWASMGLFYFLHERDLVQVLLWVIEFTTDPASVISNWEKDTDSSLNTTKNEGKRVKFEETPIKLQWQPPIGIYYTKEGGSLDWLLELKRMCIFHLPGSAADILDIVVSIAVAIALFSYSMVWSV